MNSSPCASTPFSLLPISPVTIREIMGGVQSSSRSGNLMLSSIGSFEFPALATVTTTAAAAAAAATRREASACSLRRYKHRYPHHLRLGNPHSKEAYQRKRFLVFVKILLRCLQKQQEASRSPEDFTVYLEAKAVIADCTKRNRSHVRGKGEGASSGCSGKMNTTRAQRPLVDVITHELRPLVGEVQWKRAEACLDLYLEKRRRLRQHEKRCGSTATCVNATAIPWQPQPYSSYQPVQPPSLLAREPDPLDVLPEIQQQGSINSYVTGSHHRRH